MANGKKHKAAGATLQKAQPCFHGPNAASNHGQASIQQDILVYVDIQLGTGELQYMLKTV